MWGPFTHDMGVQTGVYGKVLELIQAYVYQADGISLILSFTISTMAASRIQEVAG